MRTKTLLIGAAALAASVISSQAQGTVYSQNVVGYINTPVPAQTYAEFANQLVNGSDVNQSNNNVNACLTSGLISDPNGVSNSVLLVFTGSTYNNFYFYNSADAASALLNGTVRGWYNLAGNLSTTTLPQGSSQFLFNAAHAPMTVTITGTVLQGTNQLVTVPSGYSLLALGTPISTNINAAGIGLPNAKLTSDPNGVTNDVFLYWTGSTYNNYYYYNTADAESALLNGTVPGFYNLSGNICPPANYPAAGQGFLYFHHGSSFTYTNTFEVQ